MRWLSVALLLLILSGCSHNLDVVGRTSGATAKTSLVTFGNHSGDLLLDLKGKKYTGHWVYVMGGGSFTLATVSATSGTQTAVGSGLAYGVPMRGDGSVLMSAPDGSTLRCVFNFSEWSRTGTGVCQDSDGEFYDLQIY